MRTAVFFHYFESNEIYRENLVFFLSVAYRDDLEFFVVISGSCSIDLPALKNVSYLFVENKNNDYGGYAHALAQLKDIDDYDHFIFVNSSCRGPFFSRSSHRSWIDIFLKNLEGDVHLVGSSINILHNDSPYALKFRDHFGYQKPYSHVQTTAYALTKPAIRHLFDIGFYDIEESLGKVDVICKYEIRLSQEIKRAGWNFKSLLEKYNGIDYRSSHQDINETSDRGDPLYKGAYFGGTATPRELVYVKINRNLISPLSLSWHTMLGLLSVTNEQIRDWSEYRKLREVAFLKLRNSLWLISKNRLVCLLRRTKRLVTGS